MSQPTIIVTGADLAQQALDLLTGYAIVYAGKAPTEEDLVALCRAHNPVAMIVRYGKVGATVMDAAPALKVISKHGSGTDTIDKVAAQARGIEVVAAVGANAAAVAEKYPILDFKSANANRDAIDLVVAERDRLMAQGVPFADAILQAADKVAPLFSSKPGTTTQPEPKPDAAAKAAEVISKAKNQVPTSLSSVPAGASVHHDEGEAIRNRSGLSLLNTFEGKSADDILKLMSRVI